MAAVAQRLEFIELLHDEGPLAPRDIVEALPHSRATVTRALRELRESDLVEKGPEGYEPTVAAVLAAEEYRRYQTATDAILAAESLIAPLSPEAAPPVEALIDAEMILAEGEIPVRALEAVSDRVQRADAVSLYLPTLVNTHLLRVWHRAVLSSALETTALFDPDLLTVLKGQYPHLLAEMATTEGFRAYSTEGPPFGIVLTTTDGKPSVAVIMYEDDTVVRGVLTNDSTGAVEWAEERLAALRTDSTQVTGELAALSDAVTDGVSPVERWTARADVSEADERSERPQARGHSLPVEIESEGFTRLSEDYFDAHNEAPPAVSWRTGFTLAEVRSGHAVERLADDGRALTEHLVEGLQSATEYVVLGPPGAGKSTVCMRAACEWYERGLGPVLYRERGYGDRFDSPALLEAYLRQAEGHSLIVVEDAVREEANAIFEVMQALDAEPSVSFLLDSRVHEWQSQDAVDIPPDLDAYRRSTVEEVTVPELDETDCARFVDHFSALVDADLDLSGADLRSVVETDTGERVAGDVLLAQDHLARHLEPAPGLDEPVPTALDDAVRRTYAELSENKLAADLAVLVALLTAAGIPVAKEYLYAVPESHRHDAVDEAISRLEGRLLFEEDQPRVGSPTTYRTRHEIWAVEFLKQVRTQESMHEARERFGSPVSRLLALADEPGHRESIQSHLAGRTPHLHRIDADPGGWSDGLIERIFEVGLTNASLAPLYGATGQGPLDLPDACSAWTELRVTFWRGEMNRTHGDLARAEREYRMLEDLAQEVDIANEPRGSLTSSTFAIGAQSDDRDSMTERIRWQARSQTRLGTVARERDEYDAAREHYSKALERFTEIDDRGGQAISLKNLGIVAFYRTDFDTAEEYYHESLQLAEAIDDIRTQADCLNNLAGIAWKQGAFDKASDYLERSLSLSRELGDEYAEYSILNNLGEIAQARDEYDQAREYYTESLTNFRELGDRPTEATITTNLGQVATRQGAFDEARRYFEEGLQIKRELGDRSGASQTLRDLAHVDTIQGRYERAEEYLDESLDIAVDLGDGVAEATSRKAMGELALARGAAENAEQHFTESLDLAEDLEARSVAAECQLYLGRVGLEGGEVSAAADHLEAAQEAFQRFGSDLGVARCHLHLGRLALAKRDPEAARDHADAARARLLDIGATHWVGRTDRLLGQIAAAADAYQEAEEHWQSALETFEQGEAYPDALDTLEVLVETCMDRGAHDAARQWCQRAEELAEMAPEPSTANHSDWIRQQSATLHGG